MSSFRRIDLRSVHVVIVLEAMTVDGTIYVDPGAPRFSDAWDNLIRDRRQYVSVNNAVLRLGDGDERKVEFIAVDKSQVRAVYPVDDSPAS